VTEPTVLNALIRIPIDQVVPGPNARGDFKQWGEWAPTGQRGVGNIDPRERLVGEPDEHGFRAVIRRVGKKAAGRELDGRTWDEYPQTPVAAA
jgi:hypothetical protein